MKKIPILDGLRGVAALLVLWAHFPLIAGSSVFNYFHLASKATYAGYLGVDIFFALSGFLITRILIFEKAEDKLSFKVFYLKRALRIFPIYYICILLVGFIISWDALGWCAAYLSNYYFAIDEADNAMRHTWSLCVEEHYYLFWPLLISFANQKTAKVLIGWVIPAIAIISAILSLMYLDNGIDLVNKGSHHRMLTLALGSFIAYYESKLTNIKKGQLILAVIISGAFLLFGRLLFSQEGKVFVRFVSSSVFSVSLLILLIQSSFGEGGNIVKSFLNSAIMKFFGKISYGLYLFHQPILYYLGVSHMHEDVKVSLPYAILLLALCVGIPAVSFYVVENPLLKLKKKYSVVK